LLLLFFCDLKDFQKFRGQPPTKSFVIARVYKTPLIAAGCPIHYKVLGKSIVGYVIKQANTPEGASASARIYSLIETAKANGLEPYCYLKYLFENLSEAITADEFRVLMPRNIDKKLLAGPAA